LDLVVQLTYSSEPLSFAAFIHARYKFEVEVPLQKRTQEGEAEAPIASAKPSVAQQLLGPNGEDALIGIGASSFMGLNALHDKQITHADIKPENLLVGPKGGVICTLFSLHRLFDCLLASLVEQRLKWIFVVVLNQRTFRLPSDATRMQQSLGWGLLAGNRQVYFCEYALLTAFSNLINTSSFL
jgi:serine/threonine protein kinase